MRKYALFALLWLCVVSRPLAAAPFYFSDDFNRADNATVDGWTESGLSSIDSNQLRLGSNSQANFAFTYQDRTAVPIKLYDDIPVGQRAEWSFNMRQSSTGPNGFTSGNVGLAFVLGTTSTSVGTSGNGWAVVLGESGSIDPLRLVRFTGGLGGTHTSVVSWSDFTTEYFGVKVTWTRTGLAAGRWDLYADSSTTAFPDPTNPTFRGSSTDTTSTSFQFVATGAFSRYNKGLAYFDNVSIVIPEPVSLAPLAGALIPLRRVARHRRMG
jgi:hypothetical protein